jgi:hypothetical protein
MQVVATDAVVQRIGENGGELFVWPVASRCCGGLMRLRSSTDRPSNREFRRIDTERRFALFLPERLGRLPDELVLEVRRRRVDAYWDGCAWVT